MTHTHGKKKRLKREADRKIIMLYAYIIYKTNPEYVGWDAVTGITPKGKRGDFATAIQYMPKKKELFDRLKKLLSNIEDAGLLENFKDLIVVPPYTSQICSYCGKKTLKQRIITPFTARMPNVKNIEKNVVGIQMEREIGHYIFNH